MKFVEKSLIIRLLNKTPMRIIAMTFNGKIYLKDTLEKTNSITINHEKIHAVQQAEVGMTRFLYLYFKDFFKHWIKSHSWANAYYKISFEQEAYQNQYNFKYLETRRHRAWERRVIK